MVDPFAKAHVIDAVFISAVYEVPTGFTLVLNTTDPRNTVGNVYNLTAGILKAVGMGAPPPIAARPKSTPTALADRARRLGGSKSDGIHGRGRGRRLGGTVPDEEAFLLTLDDVYASGVATGRPPGPDVIEIAREESKVVFLFNVLVSSKEESLRIVQFLRTAITPERLAVLGIDYARAMRPPSFLRSLANNSSLGTDSIVPKTLKSDISKNSVLGITLSVTRSFFGVFLEWLLRNALNVLVGACSLIFLILILSSIQLCIKNRAANAAKALRVRMEALRVEIETYHRHANTRAKMRRALRRFTALAWLNEEIKLTKLSNDGEVIDGSVSVSIPKASPKQVAFLSPARIETPPPIIVIEKVATQINSSPHLKNGRLRRATTSLISIFSSSLAKSPLLKGGISPSARQSSSPRTPAITEDGAAEITNNAQVTPRADSAANLAASEPQPQQEFLNEFALVPSHVAAALIPAQGRGLTRSPVLGPMRTPRNGGVATSGMDAAYGGGGLTSPPPLKTRLSPGMELTGLPGVSGVYAGNGNYGEGEIIGGRSPASPLQELIGSSQPFTSPNMSPPQRRVFAPNPTSASYAAFAPIQVNAPAQERVTTFGSAAAATLGVNVFKPVIRRDRLY